MMSIVIDKMEYNERNNKLRHIFSTLITIISNNINHNEFKDKFKSYLENQNNELKNDRISTQNSLYFKTIDTKEAEILRAYIPCFIYHIESNKTYNETIDEFDHIPLSMYDILDIFYIENQETIYKLIETDLKTILTSYWCVIL